MEERVGRGSHCYLSTKQLIYYILRIHSRTASMHRFQRWFERVDDR